jgi:hypothetical protein
MGSAFLIARIARTVHAMLRNSRVIRRLFVSFVACLALGICSALLLPRLGLNMPWFVPLLAFFAIFIGAALSTDFSEEVKAGKRPETPESYDTQEPSMKIEDYEDRRH